MTEISNIQAVSGHQNIKVLTDYIKRSDKELNSVRACFDDVFYRDPKENNTIKTTAIPNQPSKLPPPVISKEKNKVTVTGSRIITH